MRKVPLAVLTLALLVVSIVAVSPQPAQGFHMIDFSEGKYTGFSGSYVPGETIEITVSGPDTETYDIAIFLGDVLKKKYEDKSPDGGTLSLSYSIPKAAPDGTYDVYLCDSTQLDCPLTMTPFPIGYLDGGSYWVQEFRLDIETNRGMHPGTAGSWFQDGAYVPGEDVLIFFAVRNIADNQIVPDGRGEWFAYNFTGDEVDNGNVDAAEGVIKFTLSSSADVSPSSTSSGAYRIEFWFNDSSSSDPDHFSYDFEYFYVGNLGVEVTLPLGTTYPPGDVVRVDVTAFVDVNDNNFLDFFEQINVIAGGEVDIDVFIRDASTWDKQNAYSEVNLDTDQDGRVSHFFTLAIDTEDGSEFQVEGTLLVEDVEISDKAFFEVVTSGSLTVEIDLDKFVYQSGETITATSLIHTSGTGSQNVTYSYEVENLQSGAILAWKTDTSNLFTFDIPADFQGSLAIGVTARNSDGVEDQDSTGPINVVHGFIQVNADKEVYEAGQNIRISYSLSRATFGAAPVRYFYRIYAGASSNCLISPGTLPVKTGSTTPGAAGGFFEFQVPAVPASAYTFVVDASSSGLTVIGCDTSFQTSGYVLSISFDKPAYAPGESVKIHYKLSTRGTSKLPDFFTLRYGGTMSLIDTVTTQTTSAEGDVYFNIPGDWNQGNIPFGMSASYSFTTLAVATEVIVVKAGANPLWFWTLADTPIIDIILLLWVVVLTLLLWRLVGTKGRREPKLSTPTTGASIGAATPPPSAGPTEPGASPMVINCRACGSPIDVTTSKRPIEVMCPSCGETEMVR